MVNGRAARTECGRAANRTSIIHVCYAGAAHAASANSATAHRRVRAVPYDMVMVFTTLAESAYQPWAPDFSFTVMVRVRGVSVVSGS